MVPTGSRDPFALRRAAQGLVKILVEGKIRIKLEMSSELRAFLLDRIDYYFREVRGFKYDEVRAVLAAGVDDLPDVEARLERVQAIRSTPDFEPLAASFKRVKNILKQAEFDHRGGVLTNLLEPGPELELFEEQQRAGREPLERRIASLRPKVDLFFDKVLVNADDPDVRRNRLTLLRNLLWEFETIADFSEIVTQK
jgi:glycyl-tRNA synthetase beta chain